MLNAISDFFFEENSKFCDFKEDYMLDFQSNFRKKILYIQFPNSNFKQIFSLYFIVCDVFFILRLSINDRKLLGHQKTHC